MSTKTAIQNTIDPFELQEMSLKDLKIRAYKLGIEVAEGAETADIVDAIIKHGTATVTQGEEAEAGITVSISSPNDEIKNLMRRAKDTIVSNKMSPQYKRFNLLLQKRDGHLYQSSVDGVKLSHETLTTLREYLAPVDDTMRATVDAYFENPDQFEQPLLVAMNKRNNNWNGPGDRWNTFLMVYLRRRQVVQLVESF